MSNRGAQAEQLAARYLQQHGLKLLHRNYRCRFGEIDLILQDGATLVFAEVRLRGRNNYVGAAASITATKQGRLVRTAQHYLTTLSSIPPCRFDVILFDVLDNSVPEWVRNAFTT
jgi:putative endonuclease